MLTLLVFIAAALACLLILCMDIHRRLKRFEASTTDTFNRLWSSLRPDAPPPPALEKVRYISEVISPSRRRQQRAEEEENDED